MGGIWFCVYNSGQNTPFNIDFVKSFRDLAHRGPDHSELVFDHTTKLETVPTEVLRRTLSRREMNTFGQYTFVHGYHRLSINDTSIDGNQPFELYSRNPRGGQNVKRLMCNGEIYNYNELAQDFSEQLESKSDVEVIIHLYNKHGISETLKQLDGDFAFVVTDNINTYDLKQVNAYVARDPLGVKPLYLISRADTDFFLFVSELKAVPSYVLSNERYTIEEVPPGHVWSFNNAIVQRNSEKFIKYFDIGAFNSLDACVYTHPDPDTLRVVTEGIREVLECAIMKRFSMSDRPVGVLLSGGFDSCVIASVIVQHLSRENAFDKVTFFTVADNDTSPDVVTARELVQFLEKTHACKLNHTVVFVQDTTLLQQSFENAVYMLETPDPDVIMDSMPFLYLLDYISRYTNVKVLLSGDGADEYCGHDSVIQCDDDAAFQATSIQLLRNMSSSTLLRVDKLASAYGIEVRLPFLDAAFMQLILRLHPRLKRPVKHNTATAPVEKYIIRKAFERLLPEHILWRPRRSVRQSIHTNSAHDDDIPAMLQSTFTKMYSRPAQAPT